MTEPLRCYVRHLRTAGVCGNGSRAWCEAHGIDWKGFIKHGILAATLRATGDPIVLRVVEAAEDEQRAGSEVTSEVAV